MDCNGMDYRTAGVDVVAGRAFVDRIRSSVEATHRPEVIGGRGGFGGFCRLPAGVPAIVAPILLRDRPRTC
jgi:phosphoribosylformylglycinamidine cyclo-ligase